MSAATITGRIVGSAITTAQGVAEMFGGGGMVLTGATACGTAVLYPAGAGAIAVGGTVAVHGEMVAVNSLNGLAENVSTLASSDSGGANSGITPGGRQLTTHGQGQALNRGMSGDRIDNIIDNPTRSYVQNDGATTAFQ